MNDRENPVPVPDLAALIAQKEAEQRMQENINGEFDDFDPFAVLKQLDGESKPRRTKEELEQAAADAEEWLDNLDPAELLKAQQGKELNEKLNLINVRMECRFDRVYQLLYEIQKNRPLHETKTGEILTDADIQALADEVATDEYAEKVMSRRGKTFHELRAERRQDPNYEERMKKVRAEREAAADEDRCFSRMDIFNVVNAALGRTKNGKTIQFKSTAELQDFLNETLES